MAESRDRSLTTELLRGLRVARSVIVMTILVGLSLPNLVAGLGAEGSAAVRVAGWAALFVVVTVDGVLVAARRFWGRARWPVAAAVLGISWAVSAALPAADLVGPWHWSLGLTGWFGVLLFSDTSLRHVVAFVAAHAISTVLLLFSVGRTDGPTFVQLAIVLVAVSGFQLAVAAAGSALRAVAAEATAAATARAAAATRETVARQVHDDRAARYGELRAGVLPLLRGIADGSAPAADPAVRRRAARAAARMRRLFAEDGDTGDLLAAELVALVDVVERRGVSVRFAARPLPSVPPPEVRQALIDEVGDILMGAEGVARVTLGAVGADVVVSVVADGSGVPGTGRPGIRTTTTVDGGRTWVEARWQPRETVARRRGS